MIALTNTSRRARVVVLRHDACCTDARCGCVRARAGRPLLPASLRIPVGATVSAPDGALRLPEVVAAHRRGELAPTKAPEAATPSKRRRSKAAPHPRAADSEARADIDEQPEASQ